ncbi:MAG: GNAT family N-acetyltransferase [Sphingobacteriales bacterium]|nr:GNAT family N-acetyltransferase [Sphingobacteriales bacterium]
MLLSNFERMIQLAEEVFDSKSDPEQLEVNEEVLNHLYKIHPASVQEFDDGNGPVVWVLLFPTTNELMEDFLKNKVSEKQLFELTPLNVQYDAIYLCSAMVLEEYRRKGIAQKLTKDAIEEIRKSHPITSLFVWPFTKEGSSLAEKISTSVGLQLKIK